MVKDIEKVKKEMSDFGKDGWNYIIPSLTVRLQAVI